jgi:hypothetical protein
MPNAPHSKASRALADIRLQLKTGKTRSARKLSPEEVRSLEARRDQLQAEMLEARRQRVASRVNAHTTAEADQTRTEVREEGQQTREEIKAQLEPLTSLVAGAADEDRAARIKARSNQVALLQAANREDRDAARKEREEAKKGRLQIRVTAGRSAGGSRKRKEPAQDSQLSTCAPSSPARSCASSSSRATAAENCEDTDHSDDKQVEDKVDQLMAEMEQKKSLDQRVNNEVDQYMAALELKRSKC